MSSSLQDTILKASGEELKNAIQLSAIRNIPLADIVSTVGIFGKDARYNGHPIDSLVMVKEFLDDQLEQQTELGLAWNAYKVSRKLDE